MSVTRDAIKLLIFLITGALALVALHATVARSVGGTTTEYSALMTNVSGLESGDLVKVAGIRVGQVEDVRMATDNQVKVTFRVAKNTPLTDRTQFLVRYENLLGDRYAELTQAPHQGSVLAAGHTIPVSQTRPALDLDVLLNGFKPLFSGLNPNEINDLANNLIATLQGKGGTIRSLLEQTSSFTNGLADDDQVIGSLITNLNTLLATLNDRDEQLRTTISNFRDVVSGLADDRDPIADSLDDIAALTERLRKLFVDVRHPFKSTTVALKDLADLLNTNEKTLNLVLSQLPATYARTDRVGSHGNFFNFYLCSVQVKITGPGGSPIETPVVRSQTQRCEAPE